MRIVSSMCRLGLAVLGGMLVVSAIGSPALAFDVNFGPEIDPTSIASAATLFVGSVMLLTAKRMK